MTMSDKSRSVNEYCTFQQHAWYKVPSLSAALISVAFALPPHPRLQLCIPAVVHNQHCLSPFLQYIQLHETWIQMKWVVNSPAKYTWPLGGYRFSHSRSQIFALAKIAFANSGASLEASLRDNPESLRFSYASSHNASNFVNTAITGTGRNALSAARSKML